MPMTILSSKSRLLKFQMTIKKLSSLKEMAISIQSTQIERKKKTIITSNWLTSLETGTSVEELDFVPQTHILYVRTRLCGKEEQPHLCSASIFLVDTDTGKMKNWSI